MASIPGAFSLQEFTDSGGPLAAGRLYTYAFGTTTQQNAFTDIAGTISHTYTADGLGGFYIALNVRGELPAPLYLGANAYDVTLKRADGSLVWTRRADGMSSALDLSSTSVATKGAGQIGFNYALGYAAGTIGKWLQDLAASAGSSFIGFIHSLTGATATTLQTRGRLEVWSADFGHSPAASAAINDTALIAAITAVYNAGGGTVRLGAGNFSHMTVPFAWASGVTVSIRGAGRKATTLTKTGVTTTPVLDFSTIYGGLATFNEIADLAIAGNSKACTGLKLKLMADFTLRNVWIDTCNIGIDNQGSLIFNAYDCYFATCNIGYQQDLSGVVHPNLIQFFGGIFSFCTTWAVKAVDGYQFYLHGTDIEHCGTTANTSTGGVYIGLNVTAEIGYSNFGLYGVHLESNFGYSIYCEQSLADLVLRETIILSPESGRALFCNGTGLRSVTLDSVISATPGDTVTLKGLRSMVKGGQFQVLTDTCARRLYENVVVNATNYHLATVGDTVDFGGTRITPLFTVPGSGALTTTIPVGAPGAIGGVMVFIRGAESSSGVSYTRLYIVALKVNGGALPDVTSALVASSGQGVPSFTFDNNAGLLRVTAGTASAGVASVFGA